MGRAASWSFLIVTAFGCGRLPGSKPEPMMLWMVTTTVVIDSASLRPLPVDVAQPSRTSIALVTTFQGGRYHPETVHALADDPQILGRAAGLIARTASSAGGGAFVDFQDATADDLRALVGMTRAIADSARALSISPLGIRVPPEDTVAFPTAVFARSMDFIVLAIGGEHRPGTSPGAPASPDFIARQIGIRSREIGVNRLIAVIPLNGFIWDRYGVATPITFAMAQARVAEESGVFSRDGTTRYLTASGRGGWTIWVPDGRTVETMVAAARNSGVTRIALSNLNGAAPDIATWMQSTSKR
jgi:hypothetical protein